MPEQMMQQLERHLRAVLQKRQGQVFGLWGAGGLGKTFTLQSLLKKTPCASLTLPASVAETQLAKSLPCPTHLSTWAEVQLERLKEGKTLDTKTKINLLATVLSELAPFVFHLEDLHEADTERIGLIQELAKAVARLRGVGLAVSSRQSLPEPFRGYLLEPLERSASDVLLEAQAQNPLPPEGLGWVFAKAQGNPLFTLEYWRYLLRQGYFWSDGQRWHWRLPPDDLMPHSLEAMISQSFASLESDDSRILLEARAVLGKLGVQNFENLWATVAEIGSVRFVQAHQELEVLGILRGNDFVHPLFGEVARLELSAEQSQGYARRILCALSDEPIVVAGFVEAAGLSLIAQQEWYLRIAATAEAKGQTELAGRWLARAVEATQGQTRMELALRVYDLLKDSDAQEATRFLAIACQRADIEPKWLIQLASNYARLGYTDEVNRVLERLPADTITQTAWIQALIKIRNDQGDFAGTIELWEARSELHESLEPDTAFSIGFSYMQLGNPKQADALVSAQLQDPGLSLLQKIKLSAVRGLAWRLMGNLERALGYLDQTVEWSRELGRPLILASSLHNRQVILHMMGRVEPRVKDLLEAVELYSQGGYALHYASSLSQLGVALTEVGRFEEAETKLLDAHQILQRFENTLFLCSCERNLVALYLSWRPPHALQLAQKYARLSHNRSKKLGERSQAYALICSSVVDTATGKAEQGLALIENCLSLQHLDAEARVVALRAKSAALEVIGQKDRAIEVLKQAVPEAAGVHARQVELELSYLLGNLEATQNGLEWLEQHGLWGLVKDYQRRWPDLVRQGVGVKVDTTKPEGLTIQVLGTPKLERGGQPLQYRGKKRLEILCYLLEARFAGRPEVSALELVEVFYSEMSEPRAKATLRQQLHLIRCDLGAESILSTPGGYALVAMSSDAEAFLQTGNTQLWRGVYLQGLGEGWDAGVRDMLTNAMRSRIQSLLSLEPAEAARLGQILLEMEPFDRGLLWQTLSVMQAVGQQRSAQVLYERQQQLWLEVGEYLPQRLEDFAEPPQPLNLH